MSFYSFMPKLLNMSLTASVAIVLVILLRLLLKKAPKVISYALWGVVLFRLLCPVSIGSSISLYNLFNAPTEQSGTLTSVIEYVPSNIVHTEYPSVVLPVPGGSDVINNALPQGEEQLRADPLEGPIFIATYIWLTGVMVMVIYSIVSYIQLRRKLSVVVPLRDNIFIADDIKSPFVVGLFRPRIYLPCNLGEKEQEYIILHERHHVKRLDHVMKALAFLALAIHWFNPLVWVAFTLASKDMEMSCDEAVIRKVGGEIRADYSASLLTLATGRRVIAGTPLAFGEGDTKGRIHNLSKWKKPAIWVVLIAVIACVALAVGLLTNPSNSSEPDLSFLNYKNAANLVIEQDEIMAIYCPSSDETGSKIQIGATDGKELAKYINQWDWKQCKAPRNSLPSPGSVEFVIDDEYRITVHQKKSGALRQYAVIKVQDDVRYYSIGRNDYADAVALVHAPAKITEGAADGKTYVYENEGIMGDFMLTLYEDGTFNYYEGMASSYLGVGSWKQDGDTITLTDDGHGGYGLVNHFRLDGDDLVFVEQDSANFVYVKVKDGEKFHCTGEAFKQNDGADHSEVLLTNAIYDAILEENKSSKPDGLYHCASFVLLSLETASGTPLAGVINHMETVTVYGLALHQAYGFSGHTFHEATGSHIPVAITFEVIGGKYVLKDYWTPRDGSYYVEDIRNKFPDEIEDEVLDTLKYIHAQKQECYDQAVRYGGVDTYSAVEYLFEVIESSPATSSRPADYIDAHPIEYRELIYYGDYTLQYIFSKFFLEGNQTGLRGHLMRAVLDDLAPEAQLRLYAETGQEYFDEWRAGAIRVSEQHDMDWIKENQPAIWLFLRMDGE